MDNHPILRYKIGFPPLLLLLLTGCDDVRVGSPDSLWLLWLVPATLAFLVYAFRTKTRLLQRFATPEMLVRLTSGVSRPRQYLKASLSLLGLLGCVLALAELKYGFTWEEIKREGVDIVVTLDVSDSMLVEDAQAGGGLSRLERAKREITDLLGLLEGDRIGLVAFAGTAFLECPLTLDYGAAEIFLDAIDTDLIPVKGTDLAKAIRVSMDAFAGASHSSRAILLITDGEDHSGEAQRTAEEAKLAGVRIFTIGIGRDEGSPIPAPGGGFRRDRKGEIVLSRLDETTLQKIALTTGGRYVRSVTGDVDLEQIYSQGIKATLEDQELASKRRQRWEERFQWLLALALFALMLEPLVSERQRRQGQTSRIRVEPGGRRGVGVASIVGVVLLLGIGTSVRAQSEAGRPQQPAGAGESRIDAAAPTRIDDPYRAYAAGLYDQALQSFVDQQVERPEDPTLALNIGSAHYQMKNYTEADRAFATAAISADPTLRKEALYNLGNSAFRQGRLEEAVEIYKSVLEADPDDEDAKFNLEFVRDEIRRRHEEAQKRQEQQQQQENQPGQEQEQQEAGGSQNPQQSQDQPREGAGATDQDRDGIPDEVERTGENPTDPENPDSDGDGLADGAEDLNHNGRIDPGETDPNRIDSDGDGIPDADEAAANPQATGGGEAETGESLTAEEAERYLQALQEGTPQRRQPRQRRRRPAKDW